MRMLVRMAMTATMAMMAMMVWACTCLLMPSMAKAAGTPGLQVQREGSHLTVDFTSAAGGPWELSDQAGLPCASGSAVAGANHLDLAKIAAPSDLIFRAGGAELSIPGTLTLSPLKKPQRASVIYQVAPRTYFARASGKDQSGRLSDMTSAWLGEIRDLGADYIWLTGVLEHAARTQTDPDVVKGEAGSYYAIYDNWDVAPELGTLADFDALISRVHAAGLRVLIDFVPNHTARVHRTDVGCKQALDFGRGDRTDVFFDPGNNYDYVQGSTFTPPTLPAGDGADGQFDTDIFTPGIQLESPARVTGDDIVAATPSVTDWFETAKLNYGWDIVGRRGAYVPRPRTWDQMLDVARYWVEKGVDGFRVDFAHPVPLEFWRYFATELRRVQPETFLLAEAYEGDNRMKIPGFSYYGLLDAGFDSVYDSDLYWAMQSQVTRPGNMRTAVPSHSPAFARGIVDRGFLFTHYMENHDELRVASGHFDKWSGDRAERAALGLADTAYLGLMPGHLLIHGGQELQEDASVFGPFAGDNGKTSIFDYVYQSQTRTWLYEARPQWMTDFRAHYQDLLALKRRPAFSAAHKTAVPSLVDLDGANGFTEQSQWISSYVRFGGGEAYLVVTNGDPQVAHTATIHFTGQENADTFGALAALGIENSAKRYAFEEVFTRKGWVPSDPAVQGPGLPGWMFYRPANVPSGLYLGDVPPATTYVFQIKPL